MVNYKDIMQRNWLQYRPVTSYQHWYQSLGSEAWRKPIQRHTQMALNRKILQREFPPRLPPWSNQKRKLSPEGKEMLKQKVKEIVSFNASKTKAKGREQGESSSSSLKERRARCFTCKKRGHVFWKCPNKRNKIRNEEQNKMLKPSVTEVEEKLKYPERVHVITDYIVEGSDNGNWDNIWYISSAYKRHMSPTKSLFERMINRFKMEDVEEKERKFIFSYGVGETTVETKEGSLVIPNVLYTPEITLNVLSIDQLEDQGYIVTYDHNKCSLKYMFDDGRKAVDVQGESTMTEED
ncbi:ARID DNA-binding domain-containing protein [Tanacetum coccineum]